jgi:putative molybdopterin biosynthesis protein
LVRADGIVRIPRFSEGYPAGAQVSVDLYRHPDQIERSILAIGSHDLTLDLLAQHLAALGQGLRLVSANVGSLSGLTALRRGECHLAGCHLLDAETGEYNRSYVQKYLPNVSISLINLVKRDQGLIVRRGNPKGITSINDLTRHDIQFINRQRGAGTRILFDYHLQKTGLKPENVSGYQREEYTHLTVAAAVASGAADVGLGIRAATAALELDFIPLTSERYDLVIPNEHIVSTLLHPLLDLLYDANFRDAVSALPGYSIEETGQKIANIPEEE